MGAVSKTITAAMLTGLLVATCNAVFKDEEKGAEDTKELARKTFKNFTGGAVGSVGGVGEALDDEYGDTVVGKEAKEAAGGLTEIYYNGKKMLVRFMNGGFDCDDPDDYALHAEECGMDTEYASKEAREAAEAGNPEP